MTAWRQESEEDLAAAGVRFFAERGWTVHEEVAYGSRTIDFVAALGPVAWAVEAKRSRTLAVLAQADAWVGLAHRVSVLVPRTGHRGAFFERIARSLGIGVLEVWRERRWSLAGVEENELRVREAAPARFHRRAVGSWDVVLHPGQVGGPARAGTAGGGRWSPWRDTMERVVRYVRAHPGCTIRDIVAAERHHYSSDAAARSTIPRWLESSSVEGVRVELEGRRRRFYPTEEAR